MTWVLGEGAIDLIGPADHHLTCFDSAVADSSHSESTAARYRVSEPRLKRSRRASIKLSRNPARQIKLQHAMWRSRASTALPSTP